MSNGHLPLGLLDGTFLSGEAPHSLLSAVAQILHCGRKAQPLFRQTGVLTHDWMRESYLAFGVHNGQVSLCVCRVLRGVFASGFSHRPVLSGFNGFAILANLIPYQRRAINGGKCAIQVEGGKVPTTDWFLNLQILTSGGFQ